LDVKHRRDSKWILRADKLSHRNHNTHILHHSLFLSTLNPAQHGFSTKSRSRFIHIVRQRSKHRNLCSYKTCPAGLTLRFSVLRMSPPERPFGKLLWTDSPQCSLPLALSCSQAGMHPLLLYGPNNRKREQCQLVAALSCRLNSDF
jgi:hypothetical protein